MTNHINKLVLTIIFMSGAFVSAADVSTSSSSVSPSDNTYTLTSSDQQILENSKKILSKQLSSADLEIVKSGENIAIDNIINPTQPPKSSALTHAREMSDIFKQQYQADLPKTHNYQVLFFVSLSMGDQLLKETFSEISSTPGAVAVFRGVKDPKNIALSIFDIQKLSKQNDPVTNIVLDPTLFREYNVNVVPTVIKLSPQSKSELLRVQGIVGMNYINDKIKSGELGDLGVRGPVHQIQEVDLIIALQEKLKTVDWNEKRDAAAKRFWSKQQFTALPPASFSKKRIIDPTVVATSDITDPNGRVLIPQGKSINPLSIRPFNQIMIIFNPTDPLQLRLVHSHFEQLKRIHNKVTLIATEMNVAKGWDFYKEMTEKFDQPIFTLTPEIASRFELSVVPSLVYSRDLYFIVEEMAPDWTPTKD